MAAPIEDLFKFYDLPRQYHLDTARLRDIYMRNSRLWHPDYHTLKPTADQQKMLLLSSLNNLAWNTLRQPDKRLQHLLQLEGMLDSSLQGQGSGAKLDTEFLMEMMELNELVEDSSGDAAAIAKLDAQNTSQLDTLYTAMETLLADWDAAHNKATLEAVLQVWLKRKYLLRIQEQLAKFASPVQ